MTRGPALALDGLSVASGAKRLLDRVSLALAPGDFVALIGPNGAGKTTLIRAAIGLTRADAGSVLAGARSVSELPARERAARLGWLPQHARADEPISALEAVCAARFRFDETHAASLRAAADALRRVNAEGLSGQSVLSLSGGERQRVAFACLIAQDPEVLLFDEPGNHLDPAQQLEVYALIDELWRAKKTILCVSHDVNLLRRMRDADRVRVVGLAAGAVRFEAALTSPELPARMSELFGIEMTALEDGQSRWIVARGRRT